MSLPGIGAAKSFAIMAKKALIGSVLQSVPLMDHHGTLIHI